MAKFSKQHYQTVAGVLSRAREFSETLALNVYTIEAISERLALAFKDDNKRFDYEHFLAVVHGERPVNSRPPKS